MYEIFYYAEVVKTDIPKIGAADKKRVKKAIETKLASRPDLYGIPLRQSLAGHRKLRVGDYRIVFRIKREQVLISAIAHRSVVYSIVEKRKGK